MIDPETKQRTDKVLFGWLLLAGLFSSLIGVPRAISVFTDPAAGGSVDPGSMWLSAAAETLLFLPAASAVRVWLGKKVGLGPRLMRELVTRMPAGWEHLGLGLLAAMLFGLTLGAVGFFAQNSIPKRTLMPGLNNPNTFKYSLRCLSAALTEEILFRLGLMTLFVWAIRSIVKKPAVHVPSLWLGNLLSALLFAGAHLPQLTFQSYGWSLSIPFVMFSRSAGMILGWLYIRYGLISAFVAHLIDDLVVYVIPRLLVVVV